MPEVDLLDILVALDNALLVILELELVFQSMVNNWVVLKLLVEFLEVGLIVLVKLERLLVICEEFSANFADPESAGLQLLEEQFGVFN